MISQEPVHVTSGNLAETTKGLPRAFRIGANFATKLTYGELLVTLPNGRKLLFKGTEHGPKGEMIVNDFAFARRLAMSGDIGFAESWLKKEWDSPNVTEFLALFCVNKDVIWNHFPRLKAVEWWQSFRNWLNRNTKAGSKRNIYAHYDLGNEFYSAWLDASMTYSSALFTNETKDLEAAQIAKYSALADKIELKNGNSLLEIGCGWGGFAEYTAKHRGADVVGLTISKEQYDYAKQRIFKAGLSEKVDIRLQDYRDEKGQYDHVASIEMIEAVGEQYWPIYMRQISDRLKSGGKAGIQAISIDDDLFPQYRNDIGFIRRYIFPGGMLVAPAILTKIASNNGLVLTTDHLFGQDYARTLAVWRERFLIAWPELSPLGFDERFRRLWEYYLSYCEAAFRAGFIDVRQMVFAKA